MADATNQAADRVERHAMIILKCMGIDDRDGQLCARLIAQGVRSATCDTCKHWRSPKAGEYKEPMGICRKITDLDDDRVTYIYAPHCEEGPELYTSSDFGCVLHEPREKKYVQN